MAISSNTAFTQNNGSNMTFAIQSALSAYSDEAYTNAKVLSGTGIVGGDPQINTDTETYIGQMRWFTPSSSVVNVATLNDATEGVRTDVGSSFATYVKSVRTHGARQINMQSVVSQQDGLAKIARDFGETRARDEHNAILSVLKGVSIAEAKTGTQANGVGGQTFNNDPKSTTNGFYVDLGTAAGTGTMVAPAGGTPATAGTSTGYNPSMNGAQRANNFLRAVGMGFKDYEPDFLYMICSPAVYADLRSANLVDDTPVQDGMVNLQTIFGGKFRLVMTRASQSLSTAEFTALNLGTGIDLVGTNTTFLVAPGAVQMVNLSVPDPVEVFRNAAAYQGGGTTDIWYRWGYVAHATGYSWSGSQTAFASDTALSNTSAATVANASNWTRAASSVLSLGILPVYHN